MRPITAALLATAFALGACSSDDDGDPADNSDSLALPGSADQTSGPAPGVEPGIIVSSDEPGGPTPRVAGLWDASAAEGDGSTDVSYVSIAENGLLTDYALNEDIGNCFERDGPFSLTLESPDTNEYSLANGADTIIVLAVEGDELSYRFPAGDEEQTWTRVAEGTTVDSLGLETQVCEPTPVDVNR